MTDASELIERLCVAAGMIMEDTLEVALLASAPSATDRRLAVLEAAGKDIAGLAAAALVIASRYEHSTD